MNKPYLFDDTEARMIATEARANGKTTAVLHQSPPGTGLPFAVTVVGNESIIMLGLSRQQIETFVRQGQALLESQS